jgi:uncharacterized tellurite resistance protein B-like protein
MGLDIRQRHDFIALLCRIAWADGQIAEGERARLREVLLRIGKGAVMPDELERWLNDGPPRVEAPLPAEAREAFINESMRLNAADCDVDPAEMRAMQDILNYYFTHSDELIIG